MTIQPIRRFWRLLRVYQKEIRQIYIYALFIGLVNLTLPLGVQAIISFLQTGEFSTSWILLVGFVLVGIAVTGILQVMQLRIVEIIQQDLFARSAFEFAYRIPKISFLQLDKILAPELVNRFFDTLTIQKGLPKILIDFSLAVFQIAFGLILLAIYNPFFILLAIVLVLVLWGVLVLTGPKGLQTSLKESKYKYMLAHWLEEIARVNRSFKLFANKKFHLNKTDDLVSDYLVSRENHFGVLLTQFRFFVAFKVMVAAGLLILGGALVLQERMSIGQFVAAEIIIILVINSVEKLLRTVDTIYDVLTALDKIGHVTDLELDQCSGTIPLESSTGLAVSAKNISFGFPEEKMPVFTNLTFNIEANQKVVLSGPSGSGKSLLLHVLAGVYDITGGELQINDVPFANFKRESLYEEYGVAFPTNQIFEGTFRENMLLGRKISDDILWEVLKNMHLDHYVKQLPQGLDSMVASGGRRLPRSVIQKLLISRLLVGNPKLLLMEDPLMFIDDVEKKSIIDYIMDRQRPWTVLVISDFYYWKEKSDKTIEMNKR